MNEDHRFGGRRIQRVNITARATDVAGACSETGARGNFGYFCNGNQWYAKLVTFIVHCARPVRIWSQSCCVATSSQKSYVTAGCQHSCPTDPRASKRCSRSFRGQRPSRLCERFFAKTTRKVRIVTKK